MSHSSVVVVHGGCGVIGAMSAEREATCRRVLSDSVRAALRMLEAGRPALDAVVEATRLLEDSDQFNAGRGSVFCQDGTIEMDAGLMDGRTGRVGGVSSVTRLRNPITVAEKVLSESTHSLLCGEGAERFGIERGCRQEPLEYFRTEHRYSQLQQLQPQMQFRSPQLDHDLPTGGMGTVGAVALDRDGHLATASSTGGLTGKLPGRVSDSSIPGAGFYADCDLAVSMTGNGDEFIRVSAARQIAERYHRQPAESASVLAACDHVIFHVLARTHAGVIAIDKHGTIAMPFNTTGMFRAHGRVGDPDEQEIVTGIYQ